ncbi:MAG: amidase [Alicyclobacillaceae bacterium]|nr:amidase [Alicyclobacillaceae bacterium]
MTASGTLAQNSRDLQQQHISAEELCTQCLAQITAGNPSLHAFIHVHEDVVKEARAIDEQRARNETLPPLAGIPIAIKDLFDTSHLPTSYGGRAHGHAPARADATAVLRLRQAGALIIGKTNLHEYAFGTTSENPHFGTVKNPYGRGKIAGGSSGGSAVAVATGMAPAALGTDTGGSIRIPAALCGVVGFKPTYGSIDVTGVFPLAPSLDHVGPLTRTVDDAAWLFSLLTAPSTSAMLRMSAADHPYIPIPLTGPIRVGIPKNHFFEKCHQGVNDTVQAALRVLASQWLCPIDVSVPHMDVLPEWQRILITTEAYSVHAETLATSRALYGSDVSERLESALDIRAPQLLEAQRGQAMIREEMNRLFDQIDVLVTPTVPMTATDTGQSKAFLGALEVPVRSHLNRYTNPFNFSGLPAISIPCGWNAGLPVGLQVIGAAHSERKLLSIAKLFEAALSSITEPTSTRFHKPTTS